MNDFHRRSIRPAVIGIGLTIAFAGWGYFGLGASNPFQEIETLEAKTDLGDPGGIRQIDGQCSPADAARYGKALSAGTG